MLDQVESIARAQLPVLPACCDEHFSKCLRSLTILPRQQADSVKGALQARLYQRKLGHLPEATLSFIVETALERCRWFPTIAECLTIASEWQRDDDAVRAKARAEVIARRERQARLDDARRDLRAGHFDQAAIDALPERFQQILETEGLLLARVDAETGDVSYAARAAWKHAAETAEASDVIDRLSQKFPSQR